MAEEQKTGVEISNSALGSLKVFGLDPNTLFTVLGFGLSCVVAAFLYTHSTEAKDNANETKATNKEVAQALRETNKDVAAALKESGRETTIILREMARATREQNCLLAVQQEKRAAMAETCRRISQ